MREEEELIREAQRSREETAKLRDGEPSETGVEPRAETSSGDAGSVTDDE